MNFQDSVKELVVESMKPLGIFIDTDAVQLMGFGDNTTQRATIDELDLEKKPATVYANGELQTHDAIYDQDSSTWIMKR